MLRTEAIRPPDESAGKLNVAFLTSLSETDKLPVRFGFGRQAMSNDPGGWLSCSLRKLSRAGVAGLSSLLRIRMAADRLPSSILEETA